MLAMLQSLVDRLCALQCDIMCAGGDGEQFDLESVNFTFLLWDHTACGVTTGCVGEGEKLVFLLRYDSPQNGRRLFVGTPWVADRVHHESGRERASLDTVVGFLRDARCRRNLKTNLVWDGSLAVDHELSLHLQFDHSVGGKALLVKDVAKCDNVLLVIDMFL